METILLSAVALERAVSKAAAVLRRGGIILYPTDTLYGLGTDALSDEAVRKLYNLKGRDDKKPSSCVVADIEMAEMYAEVCNDARLLMGRFLPGGLTLVLQKKRGIERGIARGMRTIGIRIPANDFCIALARAFGRPYTATSANVAGFAPERSADAILEQLGEGAAQVDLVLDAGALPAATASTVVDLSGDAPLIVREGAVPASNVQQALRTGR